MKRLKNYIIEAKSFNKDVEKIENFLDDSFTLKLMSHFNMRTVLGVISYLKKRLSEIKTKDVFNTIYNELKERTFEDSIDGTSYEIKEVCDKLNELIKELNI